MKLGWSTDFIVCDGEAPAAPQLDRVQASNAAWVLVEREGGRWRYVFSRSEVLAHPRLRWLYERGTDFHAIALKDALDLHEGMSSPQVSDSRQLQPLVPAPDRPSAARYVELNDAGKPVAVGGADVIRTPTARAIPTPRSALPAALDAPMAGAPMAAARPPADDEGTTPVRHPSIDIEGVLRRGARVVVVVDLLPQASTSTSGGPLDLGLQDAGWQSLEVAVTLASNGIAFDNGGRGIATIRRNQSSIAARIEGRVQAQWADGAEIEINAQFWGGTRCSGQAERRFRLEGAIAATAPPPAAAQGSLRADPAATQPDLTVHITLFSSDKPGQMQWLMNTAYFDERPPKLTGFIDLGNDTASEAATLFKQFANLERGKHRARIEGFGEKLWDRAPAEFRELYWAMHDHYARPLTIQFISDDPHLPWELMRPYRKDEVHPPLALRHAVARWIGRYMGYFRNDLAVGKMVTVAPHYSSKSTQLELAEATAAKLGQTFHATAVPGTLEGMRKLLEEPPGEPIALLYFTGHGLVDAQAVNASAIKLEDGLLAADEVGRRETKLGERHGTLVFFNACEVGATASAMGAVGGWADAFASRRFRAFIAPLWAIDEADAAQATEELLAQILNRQVPIGSALRDLRVKYGDVSPTFYSYLLYGDVMARLRLGN
jgi:hypothetical protein